jgi:hypothetical protein
MLTTWMTKMRRSNSTHWHRDALRPVLRLKDAQERHLNEVAAQLPAAHRARFHAVVRSKLDGAPADGKVYDVARRVRAAILSGIKLGGLNDGNRT